MFKIFALAIVLIAFILLHSVCGGIVRRDTIEVGDENELNEVTTIKPKLHRVHLKKFDPILDTDINHEHELCSEGRHRHRRQIDSAEFDQLSPYEIKTRDHQDGGDELNFFIKPLTNEGIVDGDPKGFEGREEEERLSQQTAEPFYELLAEATDGGRTPTDDERQRFDVDSTTIGELKFAVFEELQIFGEK